MLKAISCHAAGDAKAFLPGEQRIPARFESMLERARGSGTRAVPEPQRRSAAKNALAFSGETGRCTPALRMRAESIRNHGLGEG